MVLGIIVISVCTIWLIIGFIMLSKVSMKNDGIPLDSACAFFIFYLFPSLLGIAGGIIHLCVQ